MPIGWVVRITKRIVDFQRRPAAIRSFWPGGIIPIVDRVKAIASSGNQGDLFTAVEKLASKSAENRNSGIPGGEAVRVFARRKEDDLIRLNNGIGRKDVINPFQRITARIER